MSDKVLATTQESAGRIPSELSDIILDYLHDDPQSLRQCSLVCKSWEPSSTRHLFSRFSWPPCFGLYWQPSSITQPRCSCASHDLSFADCHELFLSSPRISNAIRHLRLSGARGVNEEQWFLELSKRKCEPLSLTFLYALHDLLPSLHTLEIWDLVWQRGIALPPPSPSSGPRTLRRLAFIGAGGRIDNDSVPTVLSAFSDVQTLALHCAAENHTDDCPFATPLARRFSATAVAHIDVLEPHGAAPLLGGIAALLEPAALRRVTLHEPPSGRGTAAFLRAAPAALEELALPVTRHAPRLADAGGLRALALTFRVIVRQPRAPRFEHAEWDTMLANAAALVRPALRELALVLRLEQWEQWGASAPAQEVFARAWDEWLRAQDWSSLRGVLGRCGQLQRLNMTIVVDDRWGSFGCLVPYLACAGRVMQEVTGDELGGQVGEVLEVAAEHRPRLETAVRYFP